MCCKTITGCCQSIQQSFNIFAGGKTLCYDVTSRRHFIYFIYLDVTTSLHLYLPEPSTGGKTLRYDVTSLRHFNYFIYLDVTSSLITTSVTTSHLSRTSLVNILSYYVSFKGVVQVCHCCGNCGNCGSCDCDCNCDCDCGNLTYSGRNKTTQKSLLEWG